MPPCLRHGSQPHQVVVPDHRGAEERLLGAEVVMDAPLRHPGAARDGTGRDRCPADLGDEEGFTTIAEWLRR